MQQNLIGWVMPNFFLLLAILATVWLILEIFDPFGDGSRPGLFPAAIVAVVLWILFVASIPQAERNAALKKCEENLPRSQHCILVAVPKKV
jgi:hypothetical protein